MEDFIEFNSSKDLYNRVLPALYSKVKELNSLGYKNVNEKDIWNYLVETLWSKNKDIQLHNLISDILYADNIKLNDYVMDKMRELKNKNDNIDEEML